MELNVKLQKFEGPLDLLLHLIDKNKVNIYDIPISDITNQYMQYLNEMKKQDLNIMSEFLVMAATLLDIKARMLLPKEVNEEGEEEDPRSELVEQLLEYKMYKYISFELKDRQLEAEKSIYRQESLPEEVKKYTPPIDMELLCDGITLQKLDIIFKSVMKKQVDKIDPVRSKFGKIEKEEVSLEDKMSNLSSFAKENREFSFRKLLEQACTKMEMIVTFLAILELMKTGILRIKQEELFEDIQITSLIAA